MGNNCNNPLIRPYSLGGCIEVGYPYIPGTKSINFVCTQKMVSIFSFQRRILVGANHLIVGCSFARHLVGKMVIPKAFTSDILMKWWNSSWVANKKGSRNPSLSSHAKREAKGVFMDPLSLTHHLPAGFWKTPWYFQGYPESPFFITGSRGLFKQPRGVQLGISLLPSCQPHQKKMLAPSFFPKQQCMSYQCKVV